MDVQGFPESDILMLLDDGQAQEPTRRNIEDAFTRICQCSQGGDIVWIHYSGHCGQVLDKSGNKPDRNVTTIIPMDFRASGQLLENDGKSPS